MPRRIKRKKIDNRIERQIITGMVVSTRVLREIRHIYKASLMEIPFAKTVAKWCLDYYKRYEKAPREHIQDIYNSHVRKGLDEDTAQLIGDFLASVSDEYAGSKRFNAAYLLDQTEERFRVKNLDGLAEDIKSELADGNITEAEALLGKYKAVARPTSSGVNPFTDKNAIYDAFEEDVTPLFTFPGAIGEMINDQLIPDNFIGLMGPEKRGKSWWADEFAFRASRQGCDTVLFKIGDMSRSQALRRLHVRLAGKSYMKRYCGEVLVPVLDCERNQLNTCGMNRRRCNVGLIENRDEKLPDPDDAPNDYVACSECDRRKWSKFSGAVWWERRVIKDPLTWREGLKFGRAFMRRVKREFKLDCHPDKSITVAGLNAQLDVWENIEGFVPRVVVVDMIDNLAPEGDQKDFRHQQDDIWAGLRAMSQKRHCLVIGTTESDTKSYTAQVMTMVHFSEDKRKLAHVTGMVGLNQTEAEKDDGITRLNWVVLREGDYSVGDMTYILQCLRIGRPCIASYKQRRK